MGLGWDGRTTLTKRTASAFPDGDFPCSRRISSSMKPTCKLQALSVSLETTDDERDLAIQAIEKSAILSRI